MSARVNAHFLWTLDEALHLGSLTMRINWKVRFLRTFGILLIMLALASLLGSQRLAFGMAPFGVMGLMLFFADKFWLWQFKVALQNSGFKEAQISWNFSEDKIEAISSNDSREFSWKAISRFLDTKKGFLLLVEKEIYEWVPFSSFGDAHDIEIVRNMARHNCGNYAVRAV